MPHLRRPPPGLTELRAVVLVFVLLGVAGAPHAQPVKPPAPVPAGPAAEQGPTWSSLSPAQRAALKPLERDWAGIDAQRKGKWLEIAERYPKMAPHDQARLQARMSEWVKMTPQQRSQARLQYQETRQVPPQDRQAQWEAYKALPEEQRRALADRARPAAAGTAASAAARSPRTATRAAARAERPSVEGPQTKGKVAPPPTAAAPQLHPVAPSVVQARPGATTTLISRPPTPPPHPHAESPRIAATPEFVDKKTLLPRAGAQGEAVARHAAPAASARSR